MANEVMKDKHISVLVEQAFATCIMVSYQDGERTFRGVLLHESSHTVTRASMSKSRDHSNSSSNLCLTAARAVTCETGEPLLPESHVNTRSSSIMSKGKTESDTNMVTPVHKIRRLVKKLSPQKQALEKLRSSSNEEVHPVEQEQASGNKLIQTKTLKRKGMTQGSTISVKVSKLDNEETEQSGDNRSPLSGDNRLPLSGKLSPFFPVLKLRKTCSTANSYVAVSNPPTSNGGLTDPSEVKSSCQTSHTVNMHHHNTRFKGRKRISSCHLSHQMERKEKLAARKPEPICLESGESLVEVYTRRTASAPALTTLSDSCKVLENPTNTLLNSPKLSKCNSNRGLNPRHHNEEMKVGDIVWGKVHGHPWWPGQILGIMCNASEGEDGSQIVKVSWYGSPTSSVISSGFLVRFQENFKQFFKKQKVGAYRRAVREAQQDAELMAVNN